MQDKTEKSKILIVSDDKYSRDFLFSLLSGGGYICHTVSDGREALEKALEIMPDIIFLDLFLLKHSGLELCKKLKSNQLTSFIHIFMIAASLDYELKIKCLEAGASDIITKPLNPIEILAKTRNLLQIKKYDELKVKNTVLEQTFSLVKNAKKEWELMVDNINDILILIDQKNTILRVNKRLKDLVKMDFKDLLGRKWQEVLKKGNFSYKILNSGEIEYYHPSGRYFNYNIYFIHNFYNTSSYAAVIILQDITGIKKLTLQLEESSKILKEKNQELNNAYSELKFAQAKILQQEKMACIGQLAAGVAHEINNPTGFVMSNLNTLLRYSERIKEFISYQSEVLNALYNGDSNNADLLSRLFEKKKASKIDYIIEDLVDLVKESLEGAERIKRIVQDLKNFSRVDEAEYKLSNINDGIESTINVLWNELKYKAVIKKEYGDIPQIKCNLGQLNQVFMNLLMNSIQAMDKQGEISIKTWNDNDNIYISIADTGVGIPEDKINRIFEPFFTTKPVGQGTGLGLSIVYDIIQKHNGNIKVESKVGLGTTFNITIPIVK